MIKKDHREIIVIENYGVNSSKLHPLGEGDSLNYFLIVIYFLS